MDKQQYFDDELDLSNYVHSQQGESLTKWTLDPNDVLDVLEMQMRGLKLQGKELIRYRDPMMSDEGIGRVIMVLDGLINKNNVLGNIMREDAYLIVRKAGRETNAMFFVNRKKWNLSRTDWKLLNVLIQTQVFMFLTRPVGGSERSRLLNVSYRDSPMLSSAPSADPGVYPLPQESRGVFSKMFKKNDTNNNFGGGIEYG